MFFSRSLPPMPPAAAECVETVIGPYAGAIPTTNAINQFRGAAGQMRIDMGAISLITDPKTGERILLNHALLEARMLAPAVPGGLPAVPGAPPIPSMKMALAMGLAMLPSAAAGPVQLGRSYIQGHEVEGMRYVFPTMPGAPVPPVSVWEIWNSVKLRLPVMTQTTGSFGQSTCRCQVTGVAPPPSTFQIPPGYKVVQPPVPGVPSNPGAASLPNAPSLPNVPSIATPSPPGIPSLQPPGVPNAPTLPSTPNLPSVSSMPSPPSVPSIPSVPSVAMPQQPAIPSATPPPLPPFKIPGR
jgi:hypothetical protein